MDGVADENMYGVVDENMGVVDENLRVVDRTAVGVVDGSSMMMIFSRTPICIIIFVNVVLDLIRNIYLYKCRILCGFTMIFKTRLMFSFKKLYF